MNMPKPLLPEIEASILPATRFGSARGAGPLAKEK